MRLLHTSRINPPFGGLSRSEGQVGYALLTRAPVASTALLQPDAPRLACVKPVASVHPEPGSNSSSLYLIIIRSAPTRTCSILLPCKKEQLIDGSFSLLSLPDPRTSLTTGAALVLLRLYGNLFQRSLWRLSQGGSYGVPFEKRVQRYCLFFYPPNNLAFFFKKPQKKSFSRKKGCFYRGIFYSIVAFGVIRQGRDRG